MEREVRVCKKGAKLKSGAIPPEWILRGNPVAHSTLLSRSTDLTAATVLWDCTAGTFRWYYDVDETIFILEGQVTIFVSEVGQVSLDAGDSIHFPSGTEAIWTVPNYVRKVAFFRYPVPLLVGLPLIALTKLKKTFKSLRRRRVAVQHSLIFVAYSLSSFA